MRYAIQWSVRAPMFRLRVGDWRVLFRYDEPSTIIVARILPRDKACRS